MKLARANEIASQKSHDPQIVAEGARIVADFYEEMKLHLDYCAGFGISKEEMESAVPSASCTAYTSYIIDIATSSDFHSLQVSMSPCAEGYKRIARQLYDDPQTKREGNIYWKWIENYTNNHYVDSVASLRGIVERGVEGMGPAQIDGLVDIFAQATRLEAGFWQGALAGVKSVLE